MPIFAPPPLAALRSPTSTPCYYDAVTQAGGIPLIIPPLENDDDLADALASIDGVVLVGGADLDPRRDGWMMHPTIRPLAPRRENVRSPADADQSPSGGCPCSASAPACSC